MGKIKASVGYFGVNRREDVLIVQHLLNKVPHNLGGPTEPLATDGHCGKKTNNAIAKLQAKLPGRNTVTWVLRPGDPGMQVLDSYDLSEFIDHTPRRMPPPPPPRPKLLGSQFYLMIAAPPNSLMEPENFYILINDSVNTSMRALYYMGPPPFPQFREPKKWSATKPFYITTPKPMGADDFQGSAIVIDRSTDGKIAYTRLHLLPDILHPRSLTMDMMAHTQYPGSGPGSSMVAQNYQFNLVDSSTRYAL